MEDAARAATPPHAVEAPAAARSSAWWLGLAAAAAVAISAGLWVMRATGPGDITVDAAPYPVPGAPPGGGQGRVYRSGPGSGDPFVVAMERYMAADYATAETGLEAVVAAQPADVQARFYLGVIRLRNGRIADALRDLQIVEQSGAVPEGLDVGWYVTLALVKSGRTAEARDRLDAIVAGRGPRAGEAQRLLDRLDHRTAP